MKIKAHYIAVVLSMFGCLSLSAPAWAEVTLENCRVGDLVNFGYYVQGLEKECAPIQWIVLRRSDKEIQLISSAGIAVKPFNDDNASRSWEKSSLRAWLNREFWQAAFSEVLDEQIVLSSYRAKQVRDDKGVVAGEMLYDKVYILSQDEAEKLPLEDRRCCPTGDAFRRGAYVTNGLGTGVWWTRTRDSKSKRVVAVDITGALTTSELDNCEKVMVRPVITVKAP